MLHKQNTVICFSLLIYTACFGGCGSNYQESLYTISEKVGTGGGWADYREISIFTDGTFECTVNKVPRWQNSSMEFGGTLSQVTLETLRQYLKETPHRSYAYGIDDSRARHPEAIVSVVSEVDKLLEDEGTKIGTNRDGSN